MSDGFTERAWGAPARSVWRAHVRALAHDLAGYHAIRVNNQYRIVFRFEGHDASMFEYGVP